MEKNKKEMQLNSIRSSQHREDPCVAGSVIPLIGM